MYSKRKGTSGICGQLYESKLISLLYFRAIHDKKILHFQLASNIDNIGAFDDICFKARLEGNDRPILVFIQAKHKENENQTLKNDLVKYFESYLKIRHSFGSRDNDLFSNNSFDGTKCLFVIYTTARDEFSNGFDVQSNFASYVNYLIGTPSGTAKQPYKNENNIEFLSKIIVTQEVTSLAERIAKILTGEWNSQTMLNDDLIMRYHVILGQKVFEVSEIKPDGQRLVSFRPDFFNTNEKYLVLLKYTLFRNILKKRIIKDGDIKQLLSKFLDMPTDATRLSQLIGTAITYDNGRFKYIKKYAKDIKQPLDQVYVPKSTVNTAVAMAAMEILSSRNFKVPAGFGNKDLTLSGSDAKKEGRLKHLTSKIVKLLQTCESSNIVTIDDSLEKGLLQLNGGLAGAIGNMFVLDEDTKLVKITDNWDLLGDLAKTLCYKIKEKCHNLHEYKFCFKIYKFPKLSFACNEYEENITRDFLKNLLFYSNQADENNIEIILKSEIESYQQCHPNYFKAKTDAIFAKYHDVIQKWWKQSNQAPYLTRKPDLFQDAIDNIIRNPLMSSLNVTYMSKIKHCNYTFSEEAVEFLNLQNQLANIFIIISETSEMTVLKVMQYFKNNEHFVLDFEHIVNLSKSDRNTLLAEFANTNDDKVFIFVFGEIQDLSNENKIIEIAKAVQNKSKYKTIIITNEMSVEILKKKFSIANNIIRDEKTCLIHMSQESQMRIFESARVLFQGISVPLNLIVNDEFILNLKGVILNKIINEEVIVIGNLTVNRNYDEIKHLYVERRIKMTGYSVRKFVRSLNDIGDDVVLVTAEPGMGKSSLLSHLSLKTKEIHPEIWIERLNLLEYSRQFNQWKEAGTSIDILETLKFMCQVVIRDQTAKENSIEIILEENNDVVNLKHCTGDHRIVFELKLFLHLYNKGKVIFLFDGFDEICPHYTNEVINCLKSLRSDRRMQKMWITSRSYNEVKTILQRVFGIAYEIDYFSYMETEKYLEKFFDFNLRLHELYSTQLENAEKFLKYMVQGKDMTVLSDVMPQRPLHRVYNSASQYLSRKILHRSILSWKHSLTTVDFSCIKNMSDLYTHLYYKKRSFFDEANRCGNPLYLFLAASYFVGNIKNCNTDFKGWELEINLFTFYDWFLKTKIKRRFQQKNEMDIYNPDIIIAYNRELADSVSRYKKLAAYTMFHLDNDFKLFSIKDLEEIKNWIDFIEKGGEKTGIIYRVAHGIPIFIHLTFTENFAVEYICDCLKNAKDRKAAKPWIKFIIHVIFSNAYSFSLRNMFGLKMNLDEILISVLNKNKDVRFNSLMKQISKSQILKHLRLNWPFSSDSYNFPLYEYYSSIPPYEITICICK